MEYILIVNPAAGKANAAMSLLPELTRYCKQQGLAYTVEATQYPGHGQEISARWAHTGRQVCLCACGGDGTLHEVINGAYGFPNASVACFPCGTGNDFVRTFGTTGSFLAPSQLDKGEELYIDLIRTHNGFSAGVCSAGIDASVAYGIPKYRRLPFCGGETAYRLSIVENLCRHIGTPMAIQVDEERFSGEFLMVTIANGTTYGGGFCAAPEALADDGLLDVLLVKKIGRAKIARVLPLYQKGKHMQGEKIIPQLQDIILYRRAKRVALSSHVPFVATEDGECEKNTGFEAAVEPAALRFRLPASLAAQYRRKKEQKIADIL